MVRNLAQQAGRAVLGLAALAGLAACGTMRPAVEFPVESASQVQAEAAFEREGLLARLHEQDRRVAAVAYRIAAANAGLCSERGQATGLMLQSALQYSPRLRPIARKLFGIDDRPAVDVVVPGSPADHAGLQPGDVVLTVDGQPLREPAPASNAPDSRPASYAPVEAALDSIAAALTRGPVRLQVQHDGAAREIQLSGVEACAYDAQVIPSNELNASADGRHVFITTGMVRYANTDETLALVLGHEFAHDVMHHRRRLDSQGFARGVVGQLGSTPRSLNTSEKEADYVGLYLTARAGYDISRAPDFWRQFAADYGEAFYVRWSHPGSLDRAVNLAATRDEIQAKEKAGEPLIPTPARMAASGS